MTGRPSQAKWSEPDERERLTTTMDAEPASRQRHGAHHFSTGLTAPATRVGYACVSMMPTAIGLAAADDLAQVNAVLAVVARTLAAMGISSVIAPFLAMPSTAPVGAAAAAGLAMVHSPRQPGRGPRRTPSAS